MLDVVHVGTFTGKAMSSVFQVRFRVVKLGKHIGFCLYVLAPVHACVHPFVQAMILKLNVWISH